MTTPSGPSYATVADFELRTGVDVPVAKEPTLQRQLDDASAYVALYLSPCEDEAWAKHPDIMSALVCNHVARVGAVPTGIRSETVGATSISYTDGAVLGELIPSERAVLDTLLSDTTCGQWAAHGVGEVEAAWGG